MIELAVPIPPLSHRVSIKPILLTYSINRGGRGCTEVLVINILFQKSEERWQFRMMGGDGGGIG